MLAVQNMAIPGLVCPFCWRRERGVIESANGLNSKARPLGFPPIRVDIITSITGVSWEQAQAGEVAGSFGDLTVPCIGRDEFISNKRALGRRRDLEALGED